jgi:hypothetical protein
MTLIVGKIKNNLIRLVSDSKITDENSVRNNALLGNLKLFIINPTTCLGFSGNTYFAEKLFEEVYSNKIKKINELLYRCQMLNLESNDKTFFCVAILQPKAQLIKIYNRKVETNQENIWIGDKLGFEKYQQSFHENKTVSNEFSKMESAFEAVINDEKIPTVSDFQISVETVFSEQLKTNYFQYTLKTSISIAPYSFTIQATSGKPTFVPVIQGNAENGSYGICYLRSLNPFIPAVAIHFSHGNFGVLFCPMINLNNGIMFKDQQDGEDFANEVKKIYKITLQGMVPKKDGSIKHVIA